MSMRLDFLKTYNSKKTISTYKFALRTFFKVIYREGSLEELSERYFKEQRDYEKDLQTFLAQIKDKPPKTVNLLLSATRTFLLENKVELSQLFWKRLRGRVKGSKAWTEDKVPSNIELRKIITNLPLSGRALFMTLESSGARIGETLQLQLSDLDLSCNPAKIRVQAKYTKSGNRRLTFISSEAKEILQEWLKNRGEYLKQSTSRSGLPLEEDDRRIFPFKVQNALFIWNKALKKTGNGSRDSNTGVHVFHPHTLRKFFRSRMATLIPVDIVEAFMGHEGYLTEVYRRYSEEDLARFYLQGESALKVFTDGEEVGKLKVEIDEKNKQLQELVNGLTAENLELKRRTTKLEVENKTLGERVEALEQDGKRWFDETKRLAEFVDRFSDEEWDELLFRKEQRDKVEAEADEQKTRAKIEDQLKKDGFFDKANEKAEKIRAERKLKVE